jgi:hypothetical protein
MIRYDRKIPVVIKRTAVNEEIIFKGKKIIREKIVKTFEMPKIINDDIGFQMQFGFNPGIATRNTKSSGIEQRFLDINN